MDLVSIFISMFVISMILVILGVLLIFLSMLKSISESEERKTEAGGVVIIGPFPIVFGTSKEISKIMLILAIVLTIIVFIVFLITIGLVRW
ncbi:MAG: DUF131 domain-containing protein [Desulfurococcaceae archaeon]